MAGHPLRPATDRRLGRPLPYQLANRTWAHLVARACKQRPPFFRRTYAVLARVSPGCPPLPGRFPRITHPSATLLAPKDFRVRLACVRHAASVQSEPGSNSSVQHFWPPLGGLSLLDRVSSLTKVLRRLCFEPFGTTEHPHKLPERIVKELLHRFLPARPTILPTGSQVSSWAFLSRISRPQAARSSNKALAVTYFRMGKPHTIIGDTPFHF